VQRGPVELVAWVHGGTGLNKLADDANVALGRGPVDGQVACGANANSCTSFAWQLLPELSWHVERGVYPSLLRLLKVSAAGNQTVRHDGTLCHALELNQAFLLSLFRADHR
jgi:hypothetical protein